MPNCRSPKILNMTAVSVFYDANINPLRKTATKKAVECWMKQRSLPDEMMFIELGFDGKFTFSQKDFPEKIRYIRIYGTDKNKYLFQKEHLWNIAAKMAKHEKLMFIDSDISPSSDVDWFKKVYDALDKGLFTQGFSTINHLTRSGSVEFQRGCYTSSYLANGKLEGAPGGVYCLCKSTLDAIGGFNFIPFGGGDDLFWSEFIGKPSGLVVLVSKRTEVQKIVQDLMKTSKKKKVVGVNVNVCHFYHGERKMRSYGQRQFMLLTQYPWMERIMTDDEQGLLSWVDVNHYFYKAASRLHTVNNDQNEARRLLSGHIDYDMFVRSLTPSLYSNKTRRSQKEARDFVKRIAESAKRNPNAMSNQQLTNTRPDVTQFWFG